MKSAGLRVVAVFEAAKGALVLAAGAGAFALLHHDVQHVAEQIVRHSHLNPASKYPHIFLDLAARTTDSTLFWLAVGALAYAAVRFAEAYGLWRERTWAEWFGALAGALYLPVEVYEILQRVTPVRLGVFAVNLAIVAYLVRILWQRRRRKI